MSKTSQGVTSCPAPSASDDPLRAAATVAFDLMKLAAATVTSTNTLAATTVLAPQRYRIQTSGVGIEFDPTDPLYWSVTDAMRAELAFAQLDSSVSTVLSDGLTAGFTADSGTLFPYVLSAPALAQLSTGHSTTVHLTDPTSANNSHYATVSIAPGCGTASVKIAETVDESWAFGPLVSGHISMWRGTVPSSYRGTKAEPSTPFNGPTGKNPYLLVAVHAPTQNGTERADRPVNCWDNPQPTHTCTSTIEIDPVAYAVPGNYYDSNNKRIGSQQTPFSLVSTELYADASHAGDWASRISNDVQEWGTFSKPVTLFGTTKYQYVMGDVDRPSSVVGAQSWPPSAAASGQFANE